MTARKKPPAPPTQQTIEITYSRLAEAVALVKPHVGTDETLPMLTGIRFAVESGALTLAGTDRYTLAIARIVPDPAAEPFGEFQALVAVKGITRALSILKPSTRFPSTVRMTVTAGYVTIEEVSTWGTPTTRVAIPIIDSLFPGLAPLMGPALKAARESTERVNWSAFNPKFLARFAVLDPKGRGHNQIILRQSAATKMLIVIATEADFIGCIMPVRLPQDSAPHLATMAKWDALYPVDEEPAPVDTLTRSPAPKATPIKRAPKSKAKSA